ncbi:MAG TPA: TetR/AcrR family transcriptional regulator [Solirubrobacteraceae bacterium]|nr:TetR/AcrR family transcriptional regulator [Solirubrobacteraceae bacterium]
MMADAGQRTYKQVARAQAQQRTREALLDAANEELSKDGWSRASLEAVAAKAGVTKQTVLRHFGSKEGLIEAAIRHISEIVRRERARAPIGDLPGAVRNLMDHYERWGDLVMRALAEEHRTPLVRRITDRGREVHSEWVAQTFEPQLAKLSGETRERRMAQLVAVCDVYVWKLLRRDIKLGVPEAETALVELVERLVEPDAAQRERKGKPPSQAPSRRHYQA